MNLKEIKQQAEKLFTDRTTYMSLLQEIAENFYPQRADFTFRRAFGQEYADNLMTSYPAMVQRDLASQLGTMLRPTAKQWLHMGLTDPDVKVSTEEKQFFEYIENGIRKAMYDRRSQFTRATKEGDNDFATFGGAVISVKPNRTNDHMLYTNWHLRDCAWMENSEGTIGFFVRRWKGRVRDVVKLFPNHSEKITRRAEKNPFDEMECYHIVCESDFYDGNAKGRPYWSLYIDCDNEHLMEAIPMYEFEYVVPRWQTVSGSQYPFSPCTIVALPDARLIQAMTLTLLEAGEKAVLPPMIGTADTIKNDVSLYAGGLTWVDKEYDERLGSALRPVDQDLRGIPFGMEIQQDSRAMLRAAFYLDRLSLPPQDGQMTAYEVGQRVTEYIRQAMPIFEPMEYEYNGALCELTFRRMVRAGKFGNMATLMPRSLYGKDYQFTFDSPLHDAIEQQKGQQFMKASELISQAAALDGTAAMMLDARKALRESLHGIGTPATWIRTESDLDSYERQRQQDQQTQQHLDQMEQSSQIAANLAQANGPAVGAA